LKSRRLKLRYPLLVRGGGHRLCRSGFNRRLIEEISYNTVQKTVPNRVYTNKTRSIEELKSGRLKLRYPLLVPLSSDIVCVGAVSTAV